MHSQIEQFIQSVRRHNPTAKTWRSYSSDLRLFASLTGEVSPSQVSPKRHRPLRQCPGRARVQTHHHQPSPGHGGFNQLKKGNDKSRQSYIAKIENN